MLGAADRPIPIMCEGCDVTRCHCREDADSRGHEGAGPALSPPDKHLLISV